VLGVKDALLARVIRARLERDDRLEVVGSSATDGELAVLAGVLAPSVILVENALALGDGDLIGQLRAAQPHATVVVVRDSQAERREPMALGANAYLAVRTVDDVVDGLLETTAITAAIGRPANP
jgi:DNA-binding NarL/FixJ family response regulator